MQFSVGFVILPSKFIQVSFGKEIYTLLLQNEIVIIPGLGAFVSEYRPAEISDDSDKIKPPSKTVSFNPLLKNNDGLLVGQIAEKLHISHFEALVRIEKEREDILFKLDKGDKVELERVGTLSYNEQGKIDFLASEEENMLLDSFGLEPMSISDPKPEEVPVEEQEPESEPEITETEKPEEAIQQAPQKEESVQEETETGEEPPTQKPQVTAPSEEKEEKKKSKAWLLLLIFIPLIAVTVFVFTKGFNDDSEDKEATITPVPTEEQPLAQEPATVDTFASDSTSITTTIEDTTLTIDSIKNIPEPVETLPQEQNLVRYYLVGGSFSVKENADNYLFELQQKGYEAFHVGKKGRFFIVGIASYNSFSEADSAKTKYMKDNPGSEVWVYRK